MKVTLFAFEGGEGLSEHTAPFDALVIGVEGSAELQVGAAGYRPGVIASVAGLITGAANEGGFKGLAGRFARAGLLRFGVPMTGEIRVTRLDTGRAVELSHQAQALPRPAALATLMQQALMPGAQATARKAFADAWQG